MIDLLIVDDSALMRRFLRQLFEGTGDFRVRMARNGEMALAQMAEQLPDVVTLDINMPEMDGLTCLSHIITRHPCPVVMVSSLTEKGAMATLEALELGAVDYVTKPGGTVSHNFDEVGDELAAKVRAAASARVQPGQRGLREAVVLDPPAELPEYPQAREPDGLVLVGVSTGGPGALETMLGELSADLDWPLVIAQHMPATFTGVLARRLNGLCALAVTEVSRPTPLTAGYVYLAQGDRDLEVRRRGGKLMAVPVPSDPGFPWHPSTDRLVESAMHCMKPKQLLGVLLTGMGDDGARAMARLHQKGGHTIAEAEESAVVYGMPRALAAAHGAERVLPLSAIAGQITQWVRAGGKAC